MKKDEKLTKEHGQPVFKGVMDYEDLDTAPGRPEDVEVPEAELEEPEDKALGRKAWRDPGAWDAGG